MALFFEPRVVLELPRRPPLLPLGVAVLLTVPRVLVSLPGRRFWVVVAFTFDRVTAILPKLFLCSYQIHFFFRRCGSGAAGSSVDIV